MGRIGIMGGTFDPIHNGHMMLGRQAYEEYQLDEIWFMPSGQPPHKKDHRVTDAYDRCEMTKLAMSAHPYFKFSDFEVSRQGNTYTAQTLKLLKETYACHEFYFIIGADSLFEIEGWFHPEEVMGSTSLMVAPREYDEPHRTIDDQIRYLEELYHTRIYRLHCPEMNVASEELRQMVRDGSDISSYVPAGIVGYITAHHLYQEE